MQFLASDCTFLPSVVVCEPSNLLIKIYFQEDVTTAVPVHDARVVKYSRFPCLRWYSVTNSRKQFDDSSGCYTINFLDRSRAINLHI
jgi:hypothetical protein